jgi:hypothetical protein
MSLDREAITNGHGGSRHSKEREEHQVDSTGIERDLRELIRRGPSEQEAAAVLGALRLFELGLLARQIGATGLSAAVPAPTTPTEDWLTPAEAATRLRRTRAWVYRQARRWSFVTRPSRRTLLISERGLTGWLQRH